VSDSQDLRLRLKAYVLQQSTPEVAQSLEAEFFVNDDLLAVLIQTEEELIERFEQGP